MLAGERSLPETVREKDSVVEDPYSHIDTAADGTLYPHNPRALLTRYWLDAGGHINLHVIECYLSALNAAVERELEYQEWCQMWPGHVSDNTPAYRYAPSYLCRQCPVWASCKDARLGIDDARPGIDEIFQMDASASKRYEFLPSYESDSKPICKVRFSEWIAEGPFNCAKGSLKDELAACNVESACTESDDEWLECEDEEEEERDKDTDEESKSSDQLSETTEGTSLGEEDGKTNDDVVTHQLGPRQLAGPVGTEKVVLINKRKGGRPHFDALQSRAAEKARLDAINCGFRTLAIRLKRRGIRGDGKKQNEEHQRERLDRTSSP